MLKVTNSDMDLGTIEFGKPYFFSYEVINLYPEILYIDHLLPGCHACTEATINRYILAPNETATLKIMFTPGDTGVQKKKVSIINHTLGRRRPNVYVTFKAIVQ